MTAEQIAFTLEVIAGIITSIATIIGVPLGAWKLHKNIKNRMLERAAKEQAALDREERQDREIAQQKKELCLIMYGLSACLDGLEQQGCNHTVPEVKEKIDKYLNQRAHDL